MGRIYFFTSGSGVVEAGSSRFVLDEMAIFYPALQEATVFRAGDVGLTFLAIERAFSTDDKKIVSGDLTTLFCRYSQCKTYREAIKSPQSVSRTLIPIGTVPRFCMGSVKTRGADQVEPHRHPMLDQLYFALPGNNCTIIADGSETLFGEHTALHIPLGSEHGAKVEAGKTLHYLWLDFFGDASDMSYIEQTHISEE